MNMDEMDAKPEDRDELAATRRARDNQARRDLEAAQLAEHFRQSLAWKEADCWSNPRPMIVRNPQSTGADPGDGSKA